MVAKIFYGSVCPCTYVTGMRIISTKKFILQLISQIRCANISASQTWTLSKDTQLGPANSCQLPNDP